jgi:hypothetical protein
MSDVEKERLDLMYLFAAHKHRSWDLTEEEQRRVRAVEFPTDTAFEHGAARFSQVFEQIDRYETAYNTSEKKLKLLEDKMTDIESIRTDADAAYAHYYSLIKPTIVERDAKEKELKDLDQKLLRAGIKPKNPEWVRATVAAGLALLIVVGLFCLIFLIWGQKPEAKLEVHYNVAEMIQALLLGSGALIAGVAYAISTLRSRNL